VIKDNYTEKQIFKVLSALHQNRLALQGYGSRKQEIMTIMKDKQIEEVCEKWQRCHD